MVYQNRMKLTKSLLIAIIMMLSIIILPGKSVFAASLTYDNDNGAIGSSDNWMKGTWTYTTYYASFRGDHRYHASSASGEYGWNFYLSNGSPKSFDVYLNTYQATNISAKYWYAGGTYGYKNQNTAPGGWSVVAKSKSSESDIQNRIWASFCVDPNGRTNTVGDGARVNY